MKHDIFIFLIGFICGGTITAYCAALRDGSRTARTKSNPWNAAAKNPATIIPEEKADPFAPPEE
jgi:hypothetical protein